jgi:hypothetical protein
MKKELKKGDFVLIKTFKVRPKSWNSEGKMNYLMGEKVKVTHVYHDGDIEIISRNKTWLISPGQFDLIEETINEPEINVIL